MKIKPLYRNKKVQFTSQILANKTSYLNLTKLQKPIPKEQKYKKSDHLKPARIKTIKHTK